MRVGCLQLNATIGAFDANAQKVLDHYKRLVEKGADLVVAPELFLSGYPPRDLLNRQDFIQANADALENLARKISDVPLILGTFLPNMKRPGKPLYNSAAVLMKGKIKSFFHKTLLPTYDVFDEDRYFESAEKNSIFTYKDWRIGITICEDIWNDEDFWPERLYRRDPVKILAQKDINLLINIAASPWHLGKENVRESMLSQVAKDHQLPLLQINTVGGNDELLFDGQSMAFNAKGELIFLGHAFGEESSIIDFKNTHPFIRIQPPQEAQLFYALAMGTRDYISKCGFSKVLIGLSGGIDSALTAAIAVEALGPDNVLGIAMPTQYSSEASTADAKKLADILEIDFQIIPIQENFEQILKSLEPILANTQPDITEENLQSRIRGLILMAISNKTGRLLLTTGNKSELAVGYCTLYGDMCGGLAVISDVLKTQIYKIAKWLNRNTEIIPQNTIQRPPSAELRPNQTDQDSLPPYEILDAIIEAYVVQEKKLKEITAMGFQEEIVREVLRKIDFSEYKRRQSAPGLKVAQKAFGIGRRRPIAQNFTG